MTKDENTIPNNSSYMILLLKWMHKCSSWTGQWKPLPITCKKTVTTTVPVNMNISATKFSQPALLTVSMKWDHFLPYIMLQGNWIKICSEGSDKSRRLSATQAKYFKPLWCKESIRQRIPALCVRRSMRERNHVDVPALLIQETTPTPWGHCGMFSWCNWPLLVTGKKK